MSKKKPQKNGRGEVLNIKIPAKSRAEGNGFQIFNGFDHAVKVVFKKIGNNVKIAGSAVLLAFLLQSPAQAAVPQEMAVRAIVGEAAHEGYFSMLAHAHAIRNRGTLKGVNGLKADHVQNEHGWVWRMAKKAWIQSRVGEDPTEGASCWFSEEDLRKLEKTRPKWFMKLRRTVKIGSVTFYREPGRITRKGN